MRKLQPSLGLALAAAIVSVLSYMVAMPESSYSGALKPLTADERVVVDNLRRHVASVASREHNLFHPSELEAAARYIEVTLAGLGYGTAAQRFVVDGKEVRNIEVEVAGGISQCPLEIRVVDRVLDDDWCYGDECHRSVPLQPCAGGPEVRDCNG